MVQHNLNMPSLDLEYLRTNFNPVEMRVHDFCDEIVRVEARRRGETRHFVDVAMFSLEVPQNAFGMTASYPCVRKDLRQKILAVGKIDGPDEIFSELLGNDPIPV